MSQSISEEQLENLRAVTARRPRQVIEHLIAHGQITTEELRDVYGYNHPPRAARDVRDQGIPLETTRVRGTDGRSITAYRFGDLDQIRRGRLGGRKAAPKEFKEELIELFGGCCAICNYEYEGRYLQVDHRIPYDLLDTADTGEWSLDEFMPLCPTDNRAKSWSCENCSNMLEIRDPALCASCYWASPEEYSHIALIEERRLSLVWRDEEVPEYEKLVQLAETRGVTPGELAKELIEDEMD